jgi:hypothetical protein
LVNFSSLILQWNQPTSQASAYCPAACQTVAGMMLRHQERTVLSSIPLPKLNFPLTYSAAPYIARAQTRTNQNLLQICRALKDVRPALLWNVSFDHSFVLVITSATKSLSSFFIFLLCPSQLCIYSGSHSFDDLPIYCTYIRKLCLLFLTDKSKSEVD